MSAPRIDLYSDTHTLPTQAMRQAMAEAEVGDEQNFEDPTVNKLCAMVAELLGQEAAVFLPSGTMCNQIAFRVHCQPGDEIILDYFAHPINAESGGPSALAQAQTRTLHTEHGIFTAEQVRGAFRRVNRNTPRSRVLAVENTTNAGGGSVWPIEDIAAVTATARENDMVTHMDGARLMNAVVAAGVPAAEFAATVDSVWLDLSKGLGCPVGAVLAGSHEFIHEAWRWKHRIGGAMRQAGVIAAAGTWALAHHVDRLAEDHENAKLLAEQISELDGVVLVNDKIETNLVFFDVSGTGQSARDISARLRDKGIWIGAINERRMRAVTHLDVGRQDIVEASDALAEILAG